MSEIDWARRGLEFRFVTETPVARYALRSRPRVTAHDPFHRAYQPSMASVELPAALIPLRNRAGGSVDAQTLRAALPSQTIARALQIIQPDPDGPSDEIDALWIQGVDESDLDTLRAEHGLGDILAIHADESATSLGDPAPLRPSPLHLHPLPRVVLEPRTQIADNTDAALSMDHLLDAFVDRFVGPTHTLPELRLATGYLHRHGMRRVLDLLTRPTPPERLRILFSGHTDRATARRLTALFSAQIRDALDEAGGEDAFVEACRAAVESGRLEVRVYTSAFLHAKLFLGWQTRDTNGYLVGGTAVVGSSNLTAPGLGFGGNLELDVAVEDKRVITPLADWFAHRWDEAEPPEPPLLQLIDGWRAPPAPAFETPGLAELYDLGRRKTLGDPRRYLAWLARLYADEIDRVPVTDEPAFPPSPHATVTPKPEQIRGVEGLSQRLIGFRMAFLADSVGLGKTITAIGTAWHLVRRGVVARPALIAPRKLFDQWKADGEKVGAPTTLFATLNRHTLERADEFDAADELAPYDLLVVEEAHESLRNRSNKLWRHIRSHLNRHLDCKLLLVSATPWNNSREDIFNYLRLGLAEGKVLAQRFPGLGTEVLWRQLEWLASPYPSSAARDFAGLDLDTYRAVFHTFFLQRTRRGLERRGWAGDFPDRRPHPLEVDASDAYRQFFADLGDTLGDLYLAHRDPFGALLRAVDAVDPSRGDAEEPPSNLHRGLLIQLYKRAESSLFALAVSLAGLRRRLAELREHLDVIHDADDPVDALRTWLDETWLNLADPGPPDDDGDPRPELMAPAEKVRYARLQALMERLDPARARAAIRHAQTALIDPHAATLADLSGRLDFDLEDRDPKAEVLVARARDDAGAGYKPVLIGGYADTAARMFLRLIQAMPSRRIGLALGGGRGWIYDPLRHRSAAPFDADAFTAALDAPRAARRDLLLSGRAERVARRRLIAAFAPRAQAALARKLPPAEIGGEIDVLVGSEAISVGQNLQDSTSLIQLDLPWNPMVIEQRIGRVDRHGGGRPDRASGANVVDVHYCWSLPAIEAEIALRDKLRDKALGAIAETEYDELLLDELRAYIEEVRAERDARPDARAAVGHLHSRARELSEQQSRVPGTLEGAGGFLDGLRLLARMVHDGEIDPETAPEPFIGSGKLRGAGEAQWLVSAAAIPRGAGGPLRAMPVHFAVGPEPAPLAPDLLAVVEGLSEPTGHSRAPRVDRDDWRAALVALDRRLQAARSELKARHDAELQRRAEAALRPTPRRDPSSLLKALLAEAHAALERGLDIIRRQGSRVAELRPRAKRIAFLRDVGLDPAGVHDALAARTEAELTAELQFIKVRPAAFLLDADRFDIAFEALAGDRWRAHTGESEAASTPTQTALDLGERWTDLDLRVDAACWVVP